MYVEIYRNSLVNPHNLLLLNTLLLLFLTFFSNCVAVAGELVKSFEV
jgi:hypothetical protein